MLAALLAALMAVLPASGAGGTGTDTGTGSLRLTRHSTTEVLPVLPVLPVPGTGYRYTIRYGSITSSAARS